MTSRFLWASLLFGEKNTIFIGCYWFVIFFFRRWTRAILNLLGGRVHSCCFWPDAANYSITVMQWWVCHVEKIAFFGNFFPEMFFWNQNWGDHVVLLSLALKLVNPGIKRFTARHDCPCVKTRLTCYKIVKNFEIEHKIEHS